MKRVLLLLISILFISCTNLNLDKKDKIKVSFNWNDNISDVYLGEKYIRNGSVYEIEGRRYKISWKYKEINTVDYESNPFTYFWTYETIDIDNSSNFKIIGNKVKKED